MTNAPKSSVSKAPCEALCSDMGAWWAPSVHPVYARLLCAELLRRGFSRETVLGGTGLAWDALHTGAAFLSTAQLQRLVHHAFALTEEPALGLAVGLSTDLSTHGPLGVAAMASERVEDVVRLLPRYSRLRLRLGAFELVPLRDGGLALRFVEALPGGSGDPRLRAYVLGHLTGALLRLLQAVSGWGASAPGLALHWPLPVGAMPAHWAGVLPQVWFHGPGWQLDLPAHFLNQATLAPDAEARRSALRECDRRLESPAAGSQAQQVRERLLACEGRLPGLSAMAEAHHVSPRTLIRRLRDEGMTYQILLDQTRADLACWWLSQTDGPVHAIAERLGFADASNFSRTFRRWCGTTPSTYRQRAECSGAVVKDDACAHQEGARLDRL